MSDLVAWLRAQLDEDERAAHSATSGPWTNDDPLARDGVFAPAIDGFVVDCDYVRMGPFAVHNATHIARHDPTRVLADVEAKRQILELHDLIDNGAGKPDSRFCWNCFGDRHYNADVITAPIWCQTVRLLALPYADRPGYLEGWRP